MNWEDPKDYFPNIACIIFLVISATFLIWMVYFLTKNKGDFDTEINKEKFSDLFEGLDLTKSSTIYKPLAFLIRRIILVLSIFFLDNYPGFAILALYGN
jgi:hypothetical protein